MEIIVTYDPKPIPTNRFDYCARLPGYEPGDPIAYGPTADAARAELLEYMQMDAKCPTCGDTGTVPHPAKIVGPQACPDCQYGATPP